MTTLSSRWQLVCDRLDAYVAGTPVRGGVASMLVTAVYAWLIVEAWDAVEHVAVLWRLMK